jgi:hypothetical protein
VLFKQAFWGGLRDGTITLTFRRWKRPQARVGGRYRTPAGMLEVDAVEVVTADRVTDAEARRAGYEDAAALFADIDRWPEGDLYRIAFHHAGEDPRIALREDGDLSDEEVAAIAARLDRLDARSPHGPWTRRTLDAIAARPGVRAGDLAEEQGRERLAFKADVRKLKALGLTESLPVGYRVSPRGEAVRARLPGAGDAGPGLSARRPPATPPRTGA